MSNSEESDESSYNELDDIEDEEGITAEEINNTNMARAISLSLQDVQAPNPDEQVNPPVAVPAPNPEVAICLASSSDKQDASSLFRNATAYRRQEESIRSSQKTK